MNFRDKFLNKLIVAGALSGLTFTVGGCNYVTRSVIQGTDHGKTKAVVPPDSRYELVSLRTKDGITIKAQFGRALDSKDIPLADYEHCPTVIYCYPGGYTLQRSEAQFEGFRHLGVNVIIPEYPGYGMSEGRPSEKGCYAAADTAYDYLMSRPDIDHRRIVAAGWSLGGGTAIDLASRQHLAGLIVISTSTKIADAARILAAKHPPWSWLPGWMVSLLASDCKFDSLAKIPTVTCPILMINGTADELVPQEMVDRLAVAAKSQVTRFPVEGAHHTNVFLVGGTPLWRTINDWLRSNCGDNLAMAPAK